MGTGIAMAMLNARIPVVLVEQNQKVGVTPPLIKYSECFSNYNILWSMVIYADM